MLVRYFDGSFNKGEDSEEIADQDGDSGNGSVTDNDESNVDDNVSTASGSRLLGLTTTGDSSTKSCSTSKQQHLTQPSITTSWSPPPPISFRSEQQQQQQHRVTHGPGGEYKLIYFISQSKLD